MPKISPRIHAVFARDSPHAVVFRRGPARAVCTVGWDRSTDTFTTGQWLRGRIYERRADLSPDGKYLIYFARGQRWQTPVKGSWTAISRAPYLKAISLWSKSDTWNGGGLFTGPNRFWLNQGCTDEQIFADQRLKLDEKYPWTEGYGGECPGVYYIQLQMKGWKYLGKQGPGWLNEFAVFEKSAGRNWRLRKRAFETLPNSKQGRGCYYDEHDLINLKSGETIQRPKWEWAEVDGRRVVWAEKGKLFAAALDSSGLTGRVELKDFNEMEFEAIEAPY